MWFLLFSEDTVVKIKLGPYIEIKVLWRLHFYKHHLFVCLVEVKKHMHTSAVEHFMFGKTDQWSKVLVRKMRREAFWEEKLFSQQQVWMCRWRAAGIYERDSSPVV